MRDNAAPDNTKLDQRLQPVLLLADRLGRDSAMGSSVALTFTTDSMGFFIFLGLTSVFLL